MKFVRGPGFVVLVLVSMAMFLGACVQLPVLAPGTIWTPEPLAALPTLPLATQTPTPLPTLTPTVTSTPTQLLTPSPTPTPVPTATLIPTRPPSPTPGPEVVTITEEDVGRAVAAGAGAQQGLVVDDLEIHFRDGKLRISASRLSYGLIQVRDLALVGRLVAQDGLLKLEVESVSPRGLVTAMIPTLADQALRQYAAQWYVEEVQTLDGRIELKVR